MRNTAPLTGSPDEALRKRRIVSVEIVGTAINGKIELDCTAALLVDYMVLLKVEGRWVIVAKSFHSTPKAAP